MRIVMCDDDDRVLIQLERYLREYFQKKGIRQPEYQAFSSGDQLLESGCEADLAFLDVEMQGRSGIYVGKALMEKNHRVLVFILTAYPDYLDEAMNFRVYRYLSKPLDKDRLFRNMNQAMRDCSRLHQKTAIETKKETCVCYVDEIVCVEASAGKVLVHTVGQTYESVESMGFWRKTLDSGRFYCSYRSFLVNLEYVSSYNAQSICLRYGGGKEMTAYLARRKYREFKRVYMMYLESI